MKKLFTVWVVCILLFCSTRISAADAPAIVPKPQQMQPTNGGQFSLNERTRIDAQSDELMPIAQYLSDHLKPATGFTCAVAQKANPPGEIQLVLHDDPALGDEGYELDADKNGVRISAPYPAGVFYGVQTLLQLLPPQIESRSKIDGVQWNIPAVTIRDWPRFPYRGFMLDSCRHIQSIDFIKRMLDLMAMHKLNRFHWHLTEDQGWRIEIKKYPKLTEVGAFRDETMGDGKRYGGFFTQDQIRDIVKYAADRFITVIPEVDMPGHMCAALASYPNLGCTGGPYKVRTTWGIEPDVLCMGNPDTYTFVQDVLDEVMDLFPSKVIHIGGDECPRDRWHDCEKCQAKMKEEGLKNEDELQNYFTHWVAKYLESKGRRLQGWNEIMKGGDLPTSAVVHVWNNPAAETIAARAGHDVVDSRTSFMYIDYAWDRVPMAKMYSCEPVPSDLSGDDVKHILGLQANLWTERRPTDKSCDEFTWPRLCAMAEVGWTDAKLHDYNDFLSRMTQAHYQRLALTGLGASDDESADQIAKELAERGAIQEKTK